MNVLRLTLAGVIGRADRVDPLEAYCIGLLLPCERKSVEPMAAITAPERVSVQHQSVLRRLVDCAKLHDYKELKQEVGLGHFEGRGWRGFHHHATMSIAVYGFLISERGAFPPQQELPKFSSRNLPFPKIIDPRGSAAAA
jgi:SRSO17 transposase